MTPQEWVSCVREASEQLENLEFLQEGATHLAAALEEIARLRAEAGRVVVPELTALREFADGWSEFRSQFDDIPYHHSGMGCGIEDRGIHDRYAACEHGWECAMERVAERFPEIDTLDALRTQATESNP